MRARAALLVGGLIAASSAMVVAQDAPESLLPPGFDEPRATPAPTPRNSQASPAPTAAGPRSTSVPVIQPIPGTRAPVVSAGPAFSADDLDPALLDQLIEAQRPKFDIPAQQARSLTLTGLITPDEGGFDPDDTRVLNGSYVAGVIDGTKGPLVSRWGHILLRRALVTRSTVPAGMNGADWVALRARLLLRLGEADAARAMVQQVDSGDYTRGLEDAAMDAYLATADILGTCPISAITAAGRQEAPWQVTRQICRSFRGEGTAAMSELERLRRRGVGGGFQNVDLLLAQKYAGSALESRKAVKIEWDGVDTLTPWRYGLALAVGLEPPKRLLDDAGPAYTALSAVAPMLGLDERAAAADTAAARGILSSAALVDLWSDIYDDDNVEGDWKGRAQQLRQAYVAVEPSARLSAMKSLWGSDAATAYSRHVLTAYAAARMPVSADFAGDSGDLLASMLSAGLDRNAARWLPVVKEGSAGWAQVVLGSPGNGQVSASALDSFAGDDSSKDKIRSRLLVAGLLGLARIDANAGTKAAADMGVNLNRQTRWTQAIDAAAQSGNQTLVILLAGLGLQGDSPDKLTALYLRHIVGALRQVGLEPEARMIAAEAVARA